MPSTGNAPHPALTYAAPDVGREPRSDHVRWWCIVSWGCCGVVVLWNTAGFLWLVHSQSEAWAILYPASALVVGAVSVVGLLASSAVALFGTAPRWGRRAILPWVIAVLACAAVFALPTILIHVKRF